MKPLHVQISSSLVQVREQIGPRYGSSELDQWTTFAVFTLGPYIPSIVYIAPIHLYRRGAALERGSHTGKRVITPHICKILKSHSRCGQVILRLSRGG